MLEDSVDDEGMGCSCRRVPSPCFPQPSKLKVIEAIGITIALGGLATIGAAIWSLFDRPDRYGITLVCVAVGVGLVILRVDLVVRPAARRIPKVRGLMEFLRWLAGLGP